MASATITRLVLIHFAMVRRTQSKSKINIKQHNNRFILATKALLSLLKPALTTLVFLLISFLFPHVLEKAELSGPCVAVSETNQNKSFELRQLITPVLMTAAELENKPVVVGKRILVITRHAAQRMAERNVSIAEIQRTVESGQLFAYSHNGLIKIGYYDSFARVFLSVDRKHQKIITAIRKSSQHYVERLLGITMIQAKN